MSLYEPSDFGPIQPGSRESADLIYRQLRGQILRGERAPGSLISQAQVAKDFGVSRGPVREAFRILDEEQLIVAEVNHRARVSELSIEEIEHLYSLRVITEALALAASVPQYTPTELDELEALAGAVSDPRTAGYEAWEEEHQRFHQMLRLHSGDRMIESAEKLSAHTHRYRRAYVNDSHSGWTLGAQEHGEMARLCREGDAHGAAQLLAVHLSRAALTLMSSMAPTHEPTLLRAAIRQVTGPTD